MYHLYAYTCKLSCYVGTTISTSHPNVQTYHPSIFISMDPIHHLKRPQLYENECRYYVGMLCFFRNIPMYQLTICIYMYKHTDGTLRKTLANLVRWYVKIGMLQNTLSGNVIIMNFKFHL